MPLPRSRSFASKHPQALGICDRCGFRYTHSHLRWQFDFRGPQLQNTRLLVCRRCEDVPQDQLRPIILPPDPMPIQNPRPEAFAIDETDVWGEQTGLIAGETGAIPGSGGQIFVVDSGQEINVTNIPVFYWAYDLTGTIVIGDTLTPVSVIQGSF